MSTPERLGETNFLADMAGIEFECSIAAAELNKAVHARMNNAEKYSGTTIIGTGYETIQNTFIKSTNWFYDYHGEHIPIVLAQSATYPEDSEAGTTPKKSKLRWLTRDVEAPALPNSTPVLGDPMMALYFNGDMLPFASFAMRLDSDTCSYVQLGSEVNSDTLFATRLDETTTRNSIVETLRSFGTGGQDRQAPEEVAFLIETEMERQQESLRAVFEKQLADTTFDRFGGSRSLRAMQVSQFIDVTEEGKGILAGPVYYEPLTPRYDLNKEHVQGWLALTKHTDGSHIDLGVVVRGTIFKPLMRVDADGALTSPYDVKKIPLRTLRKLNRIIGFRHIDDTLAFSVEAPNNYNPAQLQANPLLYAETIGLIDTFSQYAEPSQKEAIKAAWPMVRSERFGKLLSLQLNQGGGVLELANYEGRDFDGKILSIADKRKKAYRKVFSDLNVASAVEDIPPSSDAGENLFHLLSFYCPRSTKRLSGSIGNMQIGKTVGSLDFEATLTREGSTIRVQMAARPTSMAQEKFRDLYDVELDFLQANRLDDERCEALLRVLRVLKVEQ